MTRSSKSKKASPEAAPKFLSIKAVVEMTSLSRASVYRLAATDDFPKPVSISKKRVAWRQADVIAWMTAREVA